MNNSGKPLFPGLQTALNIESISSLLQEVLDRDSPHIRILEGKIRDIKYNPDKEYVLLYRFKLKNRTTNQNHEQLLTAKIIRKDAALPDDPSNKETTCRRHPEKPWVHKPVIILPGHKIVLYPFPNDIKLPWLIDAVNPYVIKERLNRTSIFQKTSVRKIKVDLLGYIPHMRASFLYEILLENRDTNQSEWKQVIGKTDCFKSPDWLFAGAWALWKAGEERIGLARPLGFIMHPRLTLQEKIKGERLGMLTHSRSFNTIIRNTAHAIARLHSLSIPLKKTRELKDEIRSIERWSNVLAAISPDMKKRIESLCGNLLPEFERRMIIRGPVHADFHHTNVFVDGTNIYLIDLDEMAYGYPGLDVGRFLSSLRIPSLRTFGKINGLADESELFLEEYLKIRPDNVQNIRLFESASLLTAAASSFRLQRPDWENEAHLLIEEAENIFNSAKGHKNITAVMFRQKYPQIAARDCLHWALDETYTRAVLSTVVRKEYDAEILSCKVLKIKKISSGHYVRYKIYGRRQDKKWKIELDGLVSNRENGQSVFSRLSLVKKSLQNTGAFLFLPQPIAYLPEITTIIIERSGGKVFSSLIGTSEVMEATSKLATTLSTLHRLRIKRDAIYPVTHEFRLIGEKMAGLKEEYPFFYAKAFPLLMDIASRMSHLTEKISPILYTLRPQHIFCLNNHVSVMEIANIRFSHPYLDAGNFLARLLLSGIEEGQPNETEKIAEHFRTSYNTAAKTDKIELSVFEAETLLHTACLRIEKIKKDAVPLKLLDYARQKMEYV